MNWNLFVTELVSGITHGSVYALIALGYSMVYGILKLLNFAHGDVYMIGAFMGYFALRGLGGPISPAIDAWLVLLLMFLFAMVVCGVLGVVIERFAYRPLRNAPRIAPLISALGVAFFLENSMLLLFGADFRSYNSFVLGSAHPKLFEIGPLFKPVFKIAHVNIQLIQVIVLTITAGLMVALTLFVARTRVGKAMRATAYDREGAAMMGID